MGKIRILLANRPQMMRELVREMISRQNDMEVVGEVLNPVDLLVAVKEAEAHAVILALGDSGEMGLCSHLLAEFPNLAVLGLASHGERAFIEQLCPRRMEIVDPSECSILDALRRAVRYPCSWEREIGREDPL